MTKDYGKPIQHDPRFNGPIQNRSCTDIIFLILFIVFLVMWGWVGIHSMQHGSIEKLLAPIDSYGNRCGVDSDLKDKKYLVYFDFIKCLLPGAAVTGCKTKQICVSKCPDSTIAFSYQLDETSISELKSSMVCTYGINIQDLELSKAQEYIESKQCASYVIKSQPVFGRCFVDVKEALNIKSISKSGLQEKELLTKMTKKVMFQEVSTQIVSDLVQSRWYMVIALLAVLVVCFLYILLLRWVAGPVIWTFIIGLLTVLAVVVFLCYRNYAHYKANPVQLTNDTNLKERAQSILYKHEFWLALVVISAIILAILIIIVVFLRARITLAIAIIKEGSKAVCAVKFTVLFPIFPWLLQCAVIAYSVVVLMLLMSIGESVFRVVDLKSDTDCICSQYTEDDAPCDLITFATTCHSAEGGACHNASCQFTSLSNPTSVVYLHLVNVLGFFWTMFFISGVSDMMLASTFSTWYWTFQKRDLPFFTLTSAILRTCSLCFCKCFCLCLENFIKFINKNAYIMCAIHGKNFCASARDAFTLLMRNIVRVVVLDKVTDFIFLLSKILISVGAGIAFYYSLESGAMSKVTQGERLHYNYVPAIILSAATYLICTIFFNVYAMAVDTLFLCFLEDCERNDGSAEKPYYMTKDLMKVLQKKNKKD